MLINPLNASHNCSGLHFEIFFFLNWKRKDLGLSAIVLLCTAWVNRT